MTPPTLAASPAELMHHWRRQIGQRRHAAARRGPRPFAAITYLADGPRADNNLIELRQLTLVALYDEVAPTSDLSTRFVGIAPSIATGALRFDGPKSCRFDKDLRLAPAAGGRGPRFDAGNPELLSLALSLERFLERCARHPYIIRRRQPVLPSLVSDEHRGELLDLSKLPKRQVVMLSAPERDLCGHSGTVKFDFVHTGFRVAS